MEYLLGGLRFIMRETWIIASFEIFYDTTKMRYTCKLHLMCVIYLSDTHTETDRDNSD